MLILTRKPEQGIIIPRVMDAQGVPCDIIVRVLSVDGDRVKLGIDAPRSITVLREELLEEVAGENREAAAPTRRGVLMKRFRAPDERTRNDG